MLSHFYCKDLKSYYYYYYFWLTLKHFSLSMLLKETQVSNCSCNTFLIGGRSLEKKVAFF